MSFEVKIPAVGESIASGTIGQWHKKSGDYVERGDVLVTIETDKISTELEAEKAGVLEIKVPEGEEMPIGAVVALISTESGAPAAREPEISQPAEPEEVAETEHREEAAGEAEAPEVEEVKEAAASGDRVSSEAPVPELKVVPAARESAPPVPHRQEIVEGVGGGESRVSRRRMSPLRKKIATHLVSAQQNAAILSTFNECDMSSVMGLRKSLQEAFVARHGIKLGFMSFFVKAVVSALKEVPAVNARIDGDDIVTNHYYDIGVAVSTEKGLFVPVIRDCDQKSFAQIEKDIVEAAGKARDGKITLADLQGGIFTVSNGGIYGSLLSTPIVNPPQSGILGMHTIQERPIAKDGEVVIRPMMYLALSYDHRLIDGREAVSFLIRVKDCIESPERLLVEA
jgi:2-oxoglutarate dehydrogenase E2 component (dihydrolipoamide succinyltransferase)